MRHSPDWKENAIILLAALGVGALYGGATALALWALDFEDAVEIGGIVSAVTGGLALIVGFFMIIYYGDDYSQKPAHWITLFFLIVVYIALGILLLPPVILSFGYFTRWIVGASEEEIQ